MTGGRVRRTGKRIMTAAVLAAACILASPPVLRAEEPVAGNDGAAVFLGNQNLPPMIYQEKGVPKGLVIDLAREIEKKMDRGMTVRAMNWAAAQKLVADGGADALLQINKTPEREKIYDFSEPLLESRFSIFANAGTNGIETAADLRGLRVGVEANGLPLQILKEDPAILLSPVPTILDGFYLLKDGGIDALVVDEWVGKYILARNQIENIRITGVPITKSYSSIAVKKGNAALLADINAALAKIREDGSYAKVIEKWSPTEGIFETREQQELKKYRSALQLFVVFAFVSVFWMILLSRQLILRKKADKALAKQNQRLSDIIEGTDAGTWEWDAMTGSLVINDRWARMLGYSSAELIPTTYESWKNLLHPEDIAETEAKLAQTMNGETEFYNTETRMRHRDGHWIWVNNRGKVTVWSAERKALMMSGTHIDITARKHAEEKNTALLAEKELILKEVHHRIKNNMNTIHGLIELQAASLKNKAAVDALNDTANRVKSMAILYERIYHSTGISDLPVADYLAPLIREIVANFPNSSTVRTAVRIDDCVLDITRLQPLGIILNELLTNIMKYAFAGRAEGLIAVSASIRDGMFALAVEDDGVGMPESVDFENSTGFGLVLVNGLTSQLSGSIRIERGQGTKIVLEFAK